jgi:amidase
MPGDVDLTSLDAVACAELVRGGGASPRELAEAAAARIEALDPVLNAVAVPLLEVGLAHAADPALPHGPFRGVPFLFKDAGACLAGQPLTLGNGLLRALDWRAAADTVLGARFRDAGFVVLGKTTMPEFGCQPTTEPLAFGPARNPWDPTRSTGGSSGGAAAAVAAGLVPVAHASDIGGSIRLPAGWCGVVGLKPSRGRTSTAPLVDPNLVEHVCTRSVRDAAAVLDAVAGPSPGDPYALPPAAEPFAAAAARDPEPLRVGLLTDVDASVEPVDPACVQAAQAVARLLESLGHDVVEAGPPRLFDDALVAHTFTATAREFTRMLDGLAAAVGRPLSPADMEPFSWALAAAGAAVDDDAYAASQTWERAYTAAVAAWWSDGFDVLLTPTAGSPPAPIGQLVPPAEEPLGILPRYRGLWRYVAPFNVTGQPAISLPYGSTDDGQPLGVQLVASLGREDLLLALAGQLDRAQPFRVLAVSPSA